MMSSGVENQHPNLTCRLNLAESTWLPNYIFQIYLIQHDFQIKWKFENIVSYDFLWLMKIAQNLDWWAIHRLFQVIIYIYSDWE